MIAFSYPSSHCCHILSNAVRLSLLVLCASLGLNGCKRYREDLDYSYDVKQTWTLQDSDIGQFVQFESVFWEADDTVSLRRLITGEEVASGRDVLEIGTGTGLLSVLCLHHGADHVVATDINPAAVANAKYNAAMLVPDAKLDVRQVTADAPGAYAVIGDDERFDLIISNPPWEDGSVNQPADHAFYDPGFALMDSLLEGLPKHLNPSGRCLLAYGHVPAIKRLENEAIRLGYEHKRLDARDLDELPQNFLPGMLVEIRVPLSSDISK